MSGYLLLLHLYNLERNWYRSSSHPGKCRLRTDQYVFSQDNRIFRIELLYRLSIYRNTESKTDDSSEQKNTKPLIEPGLFIVDPLFMDK